MSRYPFPKDFRSYIPFVCYLLLLTVLLPRVAKFDYDYRKGAPWQYETLVAGFDFPIYKTDDQIREESDRMATDIIPCYKMAEDVASAVSKNIDGLQFNDHETMRADVIRNINEIYDLGVMPDETVSIPDGTISPDLLIVQRGKRAGKYPKSSMMKVQDARNRLLTELTPAFPSTDVDSLLQASGIYDLIVPNLVFDRQTTSLVHNDADYTVSPTQGYVSAGTVIVSEHEIVTAEIEQIIDSYKKEYETNVGSDMPVAMIWLVNFGIALILTLILFLSVYFGAPSLFARKNELAYLVFVSALAALPAMIFGRHSVGNEILYVPFTLAALYLQAFFDDRLSVPVYMASLATLLVAMPQGIALYLIFIPAALVGMKMFQVFNKGLKQFLTAIIIFLVLSVTYIIVRKAGLYSGYAIKDVSALFIGSFISVAGYQLIFVFEKIFGLLSTARLDELCETSNELLRELELKAPGTFQHSLQVKNLSFACARAINANEHLIQAGAMYHDIGKMANPQCFVENESLVTSESGAKYHSCLTPQQSAHDITKHVTDGMEIAEKQGLPQPVADFIITHHGTTRANYFYNKFVNDGGDPEQTSDFTYAGRKPQTREQIILMLCDSIEAASRTLKSYDTKSFSDFVDAIVKSKIDEGQLDECDISIRELNTVKEVIKNYLAQIYHERVVYPNRKITK